MISLEEAIQIIRRNGHLLNSERVALSKAPNRVLHEDVVSDIDMPPFDKSAVDGYACRISDIRNPMKVVETIAAGVQPQLSVRQNECTKIMTGAMVPKGADCVLLREQVDGDGTDTITFKRETTEKNICYKGEDVVKGQKLVPSGTRITPGNIASLALAGFSEPTVTLMPTVGIVATGDEIVEPSEKPDQSRIRNSNAYQLIAHAEEFGSLTKYYGIVGDSRTLIRSVIERGRDENDVLLLTGGVSAGDLDLVPDVLEECGFKVLFRGVGIQPGRPTLFAVSKQKYVFGIPGSPVASFIVFELLVKELLATLMGLTTFARTTRNELAGCIRRQKTNRIGLRPVSIKADGKAHPVEYHGTAHISAYANADGFVVIPIGTSELHEGEIVEVRLF